MGKAIPKYNCRTDTNQEAKSAVTRGAFVVLFTTMLTACFAQLAPKYNEALYGGLTAVNQELMVFFASTSEGTCSTDFPTREGAYNRLIGRLDALSIQARSRPVPNSTLTERVNERLQSRGLQALDGGEIPSVTAIEKISETVTRMRETDRRQGLTKTEVQGFKGQAATYLDQAMTYESFLDR